MFLPAESGDFADPGPSLATPIYINLRFFWSLTFPIRLHDDTKEGSNNTAIGRIYLTVANLQQPTVFNLPYETKCRFQISDTKRETPYN